MSIIIQRRCPMVTRVPAPDGKKTEDGTPLSVLPEGTVLNYAYEVSYLAAGGMGVVYKGKKGSETYCIKEVDSAQLPRILALSQEKATLERLDHPGIVKIIDSFDEEGYFYLVLEFIEGKSLQEFIHKGSDAYLAETLIEKWASQIYDIFEYLHGQSPPIIYRDLKPENIMCRSDGRLCLVDFGIARVHKETKSADTYSMGTAITASPEHYGGKQTDARSDIFTIGATLSYLATNGKAAGKGFFEFIPVRTINPDLSEKFGQVIDKAVRVLPEERYQTAAEMREAHIGKAPASQAPLPPPAPPAASPVATAKPKNPAALPFSPAIAAALIIGFLFLAALIIFVSVKAFNAAKTGGASPAPHPSLVPPQSTGGTNVSFQGCAVVIPPGYSVSTGNVDRDAIEYQRIDNDRIRWLEVRMCTFNQAMKSQGEIERALRSLCLIYQSTHFRNEAIAITDGQIRPTPYGARLDHYQFRALSTREKDPDKKIYVTHNVSVFFHGEKAFLLAVHADSDGFAGCCPEFNQFYDSFKFEQHQN
jgi:serine/threonine protein kinase